MMSRRTRVSIFFILMGTTILTCLYFLRTESDRQTVIVHPSQLSKGVSGGHDPAIIYPSQLSKGVSASAAHEPVDIYPNQSVTGVPGALEPVATVPPNPSCKLNVPSKKKLILFWTNSWSNRTTPVKGWDVRDDTLKDCPFNCGFTDQKELLNVSDALVYHGISWNAERKLPVLPNRGGNFKQIWLFLRIESPMNYVENFTTFNDKFNWTSTYRLDSDVPFTYGKINKVTGHEKNYVTPTVESIRNKSLMGWMYSHCKTHSRREFLVTKLKNLLPIDIYGRCKLSRLRCVQSRPECYTKFAKKYKFWLSFENSLCPDYLTEKTFYALQLGMVPVLYAHSRVTRFLPRGSYINIWDFKTIEALANHIKFLDANSEEYLKYFEWRKHYRATPTDYSNDEFWCDLCTKLYGEPSLPKYYPSIQNWFFKNNTHNPHCVEPTGPLFN